MNFLIFEPDCRFGVPAYSVYDRYHSSVVGWLVYLDELGGYMFVAVDDDDIGDDTVVFSLEDLEYIVNGFYEHLVSLN